ncbi:MAG: hypothetical protein ACKVRO_06400 [Micropepsaceae bacterium]
MRNLLLAAAALVLSSAAANASAPPDAKKICVDRFNTENASGTIPYRMSKATYINQCIGSIRRAAKLEQELSEGTAGTDTAGNAGGNEAASTSTTTKPATTTNKPTRIQTTVGFGPKGS